MTTWYIYILRCDDGSYYIGHTQNVPARVQAHTDGNAAAFTRAHRPITLAYTESAATECEAMQREHQIKRWTRAKKEALIAGDLPLLRALSKSRD